VDRPQPGLDKLETARIFSVTSQDHETLELFVEFGRRLVEWAELSPGDSVLDVAAGTGASLLPAVEAVGPSGRVVGVDLAPGMVERLAQLITAHGLSNADAETADAEDLPLPDASFDAVLCGFGLFFFPAPDRALAEFSRLLRPGGRLAVSTFTQRGSASMDAIWRLIAVHTEVPPAADDALRFDRPAGLVSAVEAAGFLEVEIEQSPYQVVLPTFDAWWRWIWSMEFSDVLRRVDDATLERIHRTASEDLMRRPEAPEVHFPMDALLTRARGG